MIYKEFIVYVDGQPFPATYRGDPDTHITDAQGGIGVSSGYGIVKLSPHISASTPASEVTNESGFPLTNDYGTQSIGKIDYQFESVAYSDI